MGRYFLFAILTLSLLSVFSHARESDPLGAPPLPGSSSAGDHPADPVPDSQQQDSPQQRLEDAIDVLNEMQSDRSMRELLENDARGVLIIPDYGEAALIIGSSGGEGVLLLRDDGQWGNPAFYQVGSLSVGLQAGLTAGSLALVLMSERAAHNFHEEHNIGLSLEAGLAVADRSAWARGDVDSDMDVLVWSDIDGLMAEFSLEMNSIIWQPEANQDYYGQPVSPEEVLSGDIADPFQDELQRALLEQDEEG